MDRQIISFDMFGDGRMVEQNDCNRDRDRNDRDCDHNHDRECNHRDRDCNCPRNKWGGTAVDDLPLAMVYGPMQKWGDTCDPEEGLAAGTIFRELNKPFCGKRVR